MKRLFVSLALLLGVSLSFTFASQAQAASVFNGACTDKAAAGSAFCADQNKTSNPITGKNGILYKVTTIVSVVGGIIAVIMMMVGGFMFITSDGDSSKAGSARHTILYAAVGLAVIGLAQGIVALLVNTVAK